MATTDKAVAILNETLSTLEASIAGRKNEISSAYKEAVALANKNHKEALAVAEKTFKESLTEFSAENAEIAKLKNALKALTGESTKVAKTSTTPTGKRESKNWNEKFDAAYKALPANPERKAVFAKVAELYPSVDIESKEAKNQINAALGSYKRANKLN
ncbi:MAG: hypothetical protein V4520_02420 [Bacteroidota bacterium]